MSNWIKVGPVDNVADQDVMRFDHQGRIVAVYRVAGRVYATDGLCSHEQAPLYEGLVIDHIIECPMHNGRFDIRDGRAVRAPACVNLKSYPAKVESGIIHVLLE